MTGTELHCLVNGDRRQPSQLDGQLKVESPDGGRHR